MATCPTAIHACSGYGGFELALREWGVRTVAHIERDAYAASILMERMGEQRLGEAPIWDDVETFGGSAWCGRVDIVTAGFPCQPFSTAGARRGLDDDRWLWPAIARIIAEVEPRYVILENVPGVIRAGLPEVLHDLAGLGFDAEWGLFSAADVGAPHKRQRFWCVAHAGIARREIDRPITSTPPVAAAGRSSNTPDVGNPASVDEREPNRQERTEPRSDTRRNARWTGFPPARNDDDGGAEWITEGGPQPVLRRLTDGPPTGLADALHLGGNGLVPQTATEAIRQLLARRDWSLSYE